MKMMSIGFFIEPEKPVVWRGPMVHGAIQQLLRDVAWGDLDVLVVDMPPGTGDAQLSVAQNVPLAGAVIVSTPQDVAMSEARKGLAMFEKMNVPAMGLVENMSYYACPNCGHEEHIFGHGGVKSWAARLGVPFLGEVPLHIDVRTAADDGTPIVLEKPDHPAARAFTQIAEKISAQLSKKKAA
jgi:ATP-binding protein involved in chromosome partitioning